MTSQVTDASHLVDPGDLSGVARFGVFELDLRTAELRRNGIKVKLQEQPFRLLAFLLERAGDVVTREELRERLWPSEFVDFDHSLNTAVRKLREALDDSAENPRFIETLARRGYRFIAPVSWGASIPSTKAPSTRATLLGITLIVLMIGAGIAYFVTRRHEAPPARAIDAIAVLPFTNDDPQSQHLSDGLTEILIDSLSRLPDLRVMARTTVFGYKGKTIDPRDAGRALNVNAVVVGHMRRVGDRYAIHVELIDVRDGTQLWGDQFEATAGNQFGVQSQISQELSDQVRQGVDRDRRRVAAHRYTTDPQAYELYLKGLYAWNKRDKDDLHRALDYFSQAIARDPNFAAAYAGRGQTYGVMVGYGTMPVAVGVPKILADAQKALQLDPNNAEALVSLATTKYRSVWDFAGADRDYRRALALNPNYATGHQWYADLLRSMGRWDEARREQQLSYKLDPLSPAINAMMCYAFYYQRRYQEAIAFSRRASELDPTFAAPSCVANSLLAMGDIAGALGAIKKATGPLRECDELAEETLRRSDKRDFFRKAAAVMMQKQSANVETPVAIASMFARDGDKDQAFAWLEKAYQRRVSRLTDVNVDPAFEPLYSDPRFDDLLRRIGLPRVPRPVAN
jgi:TolB-like protein/DNA-binding winged helix-turn-helix (wHTH) protein